MLTKQALDKMNDEKKLLWMRDALNRTVTYLNNKHKDAHLFAEVNIDYNGESWGGSVHPFYLTDTGMQHWDRVFMRRQFRTGTYKELIAQMMLVVEFQDLALKNTLKKERSK